MGILAALCAHWCRVVKRGKYNKISLRSLALAVFGALTISPAELHDDSDKEIIMDAVLNQALLPAIICMVDRHSEIFLEY